MVVFYVNSKVWVLKIMSVMMGVLFSERLIMMNSRMYVILVLNWGLCGLILVFCCLFFCLFM